MKRLIILFIIVSCNSPELEYERISLPDFPPRLEVFAYYPLDDKYYEKDDSTALNKWMNSKHRQMDDILAVDNIFKRSGGGPNGAEWNATADIYLVIDRFRIGGYELFINDSLSSFPIVEKGGLDWIRLPKEFWLTMLRPIETDDLPFMFTETDIENEKRGVRLSDIPLKTGEVIKFTVIGGEHEVTKYFHIAYGE